MKNISLKNVYFYVQGWLRYYMYYGEFRAYNITNSKDKHITEFTWKEFCQIKWFLFTYRLLPNHLRHQIKIRINSSMPCIAEGQCTICGCSTPALQMTTKACDKPCYPAMMNRKEWTIFIKNLFTQLGTGPVIYYYDKNTNKYWTLFNEKFITREDFENIPIGKINNSTTVSNINKDILNKGNENSTITEINWKSDE